MEESEKKNNKITISVFSINNYIDNENTNIKKSEYIICPEYKEICKYKIKNYKIKFL